MASTARTPSVAVLATLDSKGEECAFLASLIQDQGCAPLLVDVGVYPASPSAPATVGNAEVARLAGSTLHQLQASGDRGRAITVMGAGAATALQLLAHEGRLDAVVALGGSGGTSIAAAAMRTLPLGLPKLIVSTVASGDVRRYIQATDITLMPSLVDIAGLNRVSKTVFGNAAAAICGMATRHSTSASRHHIRDHADRATAVGATMFGITTLCVSAARQVLESTGCEVLTYHANGTGGCAYEQALAQGLVHGALDVTTTEFADTVAGGELPACAQRLDTAGQLGIPQVVSVGATDVVNFGPADTVPHRFRDRTLLQHNPQVTLMRTDSDECAVIAQRLATKLNRATGPVSMFLPLRGASTLSAPGQPFHDPDADTALHDELTAALATHVEVVELDMNLNDLQFGQRMAERLRTYLHSSPTTGGSSWTVQ